jgi:hypothetical protein
MPKKKGEKQLKVGVLNIVAQPHPPEVYTALVRAAFREALPTNYHGNRYALIGSVEGFSDGHLEGELLTYLELDKKKPWLDLAKRAAASDEDISKVSLPDHLRPEFKTAAFLLVPERHRIIVDLSNFSIKLAQKIFQHKLTTEAVMRAAQVESVLVHVETSAEELEKILTLPRLKRLEMLIYRPNPDAFEDTEERIYRRMDADRAAKLTEVLEGMPGTGLSPSEETKNMAMIAKSNGLVTATFVGDDGVSKTASTLEHPLVEKVAYDPETEKPVKVLTRISNWMLRKLRPDEVPASRKSRGRG